MKRPESLETVPVQGYTMSDAEFERFAAANDVLHIERDEQKQIFIMAPISLEGGEWENSFSDALRAWGKKNPMGKTVGSNVGFHLPDGSSRSPDAAWISEAQYAPLTREEKRRFLRLCPEFVVEILSPSDSLVQLQEKMVRWIENGAQLAWLFAPDYEKAWVYRPEAEPAEHPWHNPLDASPLLPGFRIVPAEVFGV